MRRDRDGLAGEVEGVAVQVGHNLHFVGIFKFFLGGEVGHEVHDVDGRILEHGFDGGVDHVGGNHGFVTLHHDHDVGALPVISSILSMASAVRVVQRTWVSAVITALSPAEAA